MKLSQFGTTFFGASYCQKTAQAKRIPYITHAHAHTLRPIGKNTCTHTTTKMPRRIFVICMHFVCAHIRMHATRMYCRSDACFLHGNTAISENCVAIGSTLAHAAASEYPMRCISLGATAFHRRGTPRNLAIHGQKDERLSLTLFIYCLLFMRRIECIGNWYACIGPIYIAYARTHTCMCSECTRHVCASVQCSVNAMQLAQIDCGHANTVNGYHSNDNIPSFLMTSLD